jgi:hypothetical protein
MFCFLFNYTIKIIIDNDSKSTELNKNLIIMICREKIYLLIFWKDFYNINQ